MCTFFASRQARGRTPSAAFASASALGLALLSAVAMGGVLSGWAWPPSPQDAAPRTGAPVILIFGDSLSAAYRMKTRDAWPALLQERLRREGFAAQVVNASRSGETTKGGRARLPAALARHQPAILILELGGNDGLRGVPLSQVRDNLADMIAQGQEAGAQVLLTGMRIPPNYGPYAQRFAAIYPQLAEEYSTALVPFLLAGVALNPLLMQADGIHPNARAQTRILDNVHPYLMPLLRALVTHSAGYQGTGLTGNALGFLPLNL